MPDDGRIKYTQYRVGLSTYSRSLMIPVRLSEKFHAHDKTDATNSLDARQKREKKSSPERFEHSRAKPNR